MKKEDKQLLINDLSSRLSYGVYIQHIRTGIRGKLNDLFVLRKYNDCDTVQEIDGHVRNFFGEDDYTDVTLFKPYLRPMSSMTEEEKKEYIVLDDLVTVDGVLVSSCSTFDWLNAHHFDYRGLIKKGLALEAPKDMYNTYEINPQ